MTEIPWQMVKSLAERPELDPLGAFRINPDQLLGVREMSLRGKALDEFLKGIQTNVASTFQAVPLMLDRK